MTKSDTKFDPEHTMGGVNDASYWMQEALWDYMHNPTDDNFLSVQKSSPLVAQASREVVEFIATTHQQRKAEHVDDY